MDLIEPKRLTSFEPYSIEIITHSDKEKSPGSKTIGPFYGFNTVADFLNIDDYLDAGFDGAVIDLDKICSDV